MKMLSEFNLANPTIEALKTLNGTGTNEQIRELVIRRMALPQQELERRHGNGTKLEIDYRLGWSRTVLKTLELISGSGPGRWALTESGHNWQPVEPPAIRKLYNHRRAQERGKNSPKDDNPVITDEIVYETVAANQPVEETAWRMLGLRQFVSGYGAADAIYETPSDYRPAVHRMAFRPGEVVSLDFPFTDLEGSKERPALVLLDTGDADIVVARITGEAARDRFDIAVEALEPAGLSIPSIVRVHKLLTVEKRLVQQRRGILAESDWLKVREAAVRLWLGA